MPLPSSPSLPSTADVVVIGGGIAGVAAAAHLAVDHSVVLVEAEAALAHHTTGRSAAQFLENYGGPINRMLTIASRAFFEHPPETATDVALLTPRPMLMVGGPAETNELDRAAVEGAELVPSIRRIDADETTAICPALETDHIAGGVLEPDAADIDVMALHQSFVRLARRHRAVVVRSAAVTGLAKAGAGWRVTTTAGSTSCAVVVNAAGAWVDRVAALGGIRPVGAMPLRRTAFTVDGPASASSWPLVYFADDSLYFKPEAGGQLLVSPSDETPDHPHDVRPAEIDIALALDRLNELTDLDVRHVRSSWAGLRTFVADRGPVIGADDEDPSLVWMAGQGGTGIQTAPAAGRLVASLVEGASVPDDLAALGLTAAAVSPARPGVTRVPAEGTAAR